VFLFVFVSGLFWSVTAYIRMTHTVNRTAIKLRV